MERCVICHYYDRRNGKSNDGKAMQAGQCRRAAPALNPVNAKSYMIEGVWPTVRDDDWCGEWKALVRRAEPGRASEASSAIGALPRAPMEGSHPRAVVGADPTPSSPRSANVISVLPASAPSGAGVTANTFAFGSGRAD